MMHVCAFARPEYPMPIYGYDVIAGKRKITGCFHDVSPTVSTDLTDEHYQDFHNLVKSYLPTKPRELPLWAKEIFSPSMIAAGNVTDKLEVKRLTQYGLDNLNRWFGFLERQEPCLDYDLIVAHENAKSKYCHNQLQNPNSKNVMISLGLDKDYVEQFKKIQFPY